MLSMPMRTVVAQALRAGGHGLPAKSLSSRVAVVGRSFLVAPSYKLRVAARGYATATATAKKTTTAKKPAAKKPVAKKPVAKKAAAKKPAAKKTAKATKAKTVTKKKAAAKPKKKAAKKPVDKEKLAVLEKRQLKKTALLHEGPKNLPTVPWLVYTCDKIKGDTSLVGPAALGTKMTSLAAEFKTLTASDKERLRQKANENKVINEANHKKWVETHTVAEIEAATRARKRLNRVYKMSVKQPSILDHRMPKRPATSGWSYYLKAHYVHGTSFVETARGLAQQWQGLSAPEKKPYVDLAAAEIAKYHNQREQILA